MTVSVNNPPSGFPSLFTKNVFTVSGRVPGTIYQNLTGQPIIVMATIGSSASNLVTVVCDASATPTTVIAEFLSGAGFNVPFVFVVPANFFYKISGSTAANSSWVEFTINSGSVTASGDISGSRSLTTTFQNTTGKALLVVVDISGVSVNAVVQALNDATSPPATVQFDFTQSVASAHVTAFLLVPNNWFYKVTASTGTLAHWNEYTMPFGATRSADLTASPVQRGFVGSLSGVNIQPNYLNLSPTAKDLWVALWCIPGSTGTLTGRSTPIGQGQNIIISAVLGCSNVGSTMVPTAMIVQPYDFYCVGFDSTSTFSATHWWEYVLG